MNITGSAEYLIQISSREYRLGGLTVYADKANEGLIRVYVPRQAVEIFIDPVRENFYSGT